EASQLRDASTGRLLAFSFFLLYCCGYNRALHSFPTRRSSDLSFSQFKVRLVQIVQPSDGPPFVQMQGFNFGARFPIQTIGAVARSEEHTSELQSRGHLVCRLLLEKKKSIRASVDCRDEKLHTH